MTDTNWTAERDMTNIQYRLALAQLDLSKAAAARFLGIAPRTSSRYWYGKSEIPPAVAILLRGLCHTNTTPIVPKWTKND